MRTFIFVLIAISLMSFQGRSYNYEKAWQEVEAFMNQNLPQSALNKTKEIYGVARREKNNPNLLKAISFRASLSQVLAEEESTDHITFLWEEYASLKSTPRSVVALILYSNLNSYFYNYQYKIKDRTYVQGASYENINDWSAINYEKTLLFLAEEVFSNLDALDVKVSQYKPILTKYTDIGSNLRPTLVDVASHYLLEQIANPRSTASSFEWTFDINKETYLSDYQNFINVNIECEDETNMNFRSLKIFQKLIRFHLDKGNKDALLDAEISRLKYVLQLSTLDNKNELYLKTLDVYSDGFTDQFNSGRILYEKASTWNNMSGIEGQAHLRKQAYDLCINNADDSYYGNLMGQLAKNIVRKQLNAQVDQVFTTADSISVVLRTNNIEELAWRLVELPRDFKNQFRRLYENDFHNYLLTLPAVLSGTHNIDKDPNFFTVVSRLKISPNTYGNYAIILSPSQNFKNIEEGMMMVPFQVSDIAYASLGNDAVNLLVADRISGAPISGALVKVYTSYYDRSSRQNKKQFVTEIKTDRDGKAYYTSKDGKSVSVTISNGEDHIDLDDGFYIYDYPRQQPPRMEAMIFTDRAIYRPGQKLHFKGLLLSRDQFGIPEVGTSGAEIEVVLRDVNYQEVQSIKLRSNEFGSVSGHFILPSSGLTGQYTIELKGRDNLFSSHGIKVEEYRRPNFKVTLDQPSGKYELGDTIRMSGNAKAFSSASISGGEVVYKIYRSEVRRWSWYGGRFSQDDDRVLLSYGTSLTDINGDFDLEFIARGNQNKSWNFEVEVEVTDVNGETQSSSIDMVIGKNALNISLTGNKLRTVEDTSWLAINVTNQSGESINEAVSVKIIELVPGEEGGITIENDDPLQVIRNWEHKMTTQWLTFSGTQDKSLNLNILSPGAYKIEMTVGETTVEDYLIVLDFQEGQFPVAADLYVEKIDGNYVPGNEVELRIGTPHKSLFIYHEEDRRAGREHYGWRNLQGTDTIKTTVKKDDFGGYYVVLTYFYENRFKTIATKINVPWTHKDLNFELVSFRNTLLPGSDEEWQVKISGKDKDQKAIEMLASMYDMSLDQFVYHNWNANLYPGYSSRELWRGKGFSSLNGMHLVNRWNSVITTDKTLFAVRYPMFTILADRYGSVSRMRRGDNIMIRGTSAEPSMMEADAMMSKESGQASEETVLSEDEYTELVKVGDVPGDGVQPLRSDLDETVFFYPHLLTDEDGNVIFKFKMKEALTRWKLMLFAHDKDLRYGMKTQEIITKKDLMITPYFPRFFRHGDHVIVTSKVNNLTDENIDVSIIMEAYNARTMEPVNNSLGINENEFGLSIPARGNGNAQWEFLIPEKLLDPILYRVWARSSSHTDGQEGMVPVLSNKILITETKAITIDPDETYVFTTEDLKGSASRDVMNITLDYTAHPAWTAIQSLPYLADYPHECVEQMMNKLYANEVGAKILQSIPGIQRVMEQWNATDSDALLSNLQKNQELKSVLIEETPWLRDALSESEQRKSIAMLLDENNLRVQSNGYLSRILQSQSGDGGFPWFSGGRSNTYITQYVVESLTRMEEMGIERIRGDKVESMITRAIGFMDEELQFRYEKLKERISQHGGNLEDDHITSLDIHYLYVRSNHPQIQYAGGAEAAKEYYFGQAMKYWMNKTDLSQALIGMTAHRSSEKNVRDVILQSFKERAIKDELGMYWKLNRGYFWYQQPIETQTAIIRLFHEVREDDQELNAMKLWLLNQKRTQSWASTKATADAIHAMLLPSGQSEYWLEDASEPTIKINGKDLDTRAEAGTGYIKKRMEGEGVETISITNHNNNIGWGGIYMQYMQDVGQVESSGDGDISVVKEVFKEVAVGNRVELKALDEASLKIGDVLVTRLVIRVDRDMEFVHLKDMRGSGTEPVNVLSGYRWKGGLGYYESTRDAGTHFFIDYLSKGNYVFEYKTRISHSGSYNNGIASIQCMYAPEFSSHSSSQKINIK